MNKHILIVLVLLSIPGALYASTYGQPYGSNDATEMEQSNVKTIDQINRSTEIEEPAESVEQEVEPVPEENNQEDVPESDSEPAENESPIPEQQNSSTQ